MALYEIKVNDCESPPEIWEVDGQSELFAVIRQSLKGKAAPTYLVLTVSIIKRRKARKVEAVTDEQIPD